MFTHSAKFRPEDVLRTSQKVMSYISITFYGLGLLCNSKGRVLLTSWGRPSETSLYSSVNNAEKVQEIRTSVLACSINECYTTKMTSAAQQIDNMKRRNMNYASYLSSKVLSISIIFFHQFNKFFSSKLPNFTAKLAIH